MDPWGGSQTEPATLHRYLYAGNNPVMMVDPSGEMTLASQVATISVFSILTSMAVDYTLTRTTTRARRNTYLYFYHGTDSKRALSIIVMGPISNEAKKGFFTVEQEHLSYAESLARFKSDDAPNTEPAIVEMKINIALYDELYMSGGVKVEQNFSMQGGYWEFTEYIFLPKVYHLLTPTSFGVSYRYYTLGN